MNQANGGSKAAEPSRGHALLARFAQSWHGSAGLVVWLALPCVAKISEGLIDTAATGGLGWPGWSTGLDPHRHFATRGPGYRTAGRREPLNLERGEPKGRVFYEAFYQ